MTSAQMLLIVSDGIGWPVDRWYLSSGEVVAGQVIALEGSSAGFNYAAATANHGTGAWHHIFAVFAGANERYVWLNGANKGSSTGAGQCGGTAANVSLGHLVDAGNPYARLAAGAALADVAIWNLTDLDPTPWTDGTIAAALAGGKSAVWYPRGLAAWWPLGNPYGANDDLDRMGGYDLTPYNEPIYGDGPALIYPPAPSLGGQVARRTLLGAAPVFGGRVMRRV